MADPIDELAATFEKVQEAVAALTAFLEEKAPNDNELFHGVLRESLQAEGGSPAENAGRLINGLLNLAALLAIDLGEAKGTTPLEALQGVAQDAATLLAAVEEHRRRDEPDG